MYYAKGSKKDRDDESVCPKYHDAHESPNLPRGEMLFGNIKECIHIHNPFRYKLTTFTKFINQIITFIEMEMSVMSDMFVMDSIFAVLLGLISFECFIVLP